MAGLGWMTGLGWMAELYGHWMAEVRWMDALSRVVAPEPVAPAG